MSVEQNTIFDAIASREAAEAGIAQAGENKKSLLKLARQLAVEAAKRKGIISMDDVSFALHEKGISIFALGNAAGGVFKGKEWQWTGCYIKSVRVHAHANQLRTWRLKAA